ncbi:MAG TPA: hypothetical protein VF982_02610 [Anaerolineales bacterium]
MTPHHHTFGSDTATRYYLMRGNKYLNWSGHIFTKDERCAWLGTIGHLEAFREHHPIAHADSVRIIEAVSKIPQHEEMEA